MVGTSLATWWKESIATCHKEKIANWRNTASRTQLLLYSIWYMNLLRFFFFNYFFFVEANLYENYKNYELLYRIWYMNP